MNANIAAVAALILFVIAAFMYAVDEAWGHALVAAGLACLVIAGLFNYRVGQNVG